MSKKINTDRLLGISAMVISILTLVIFIYQTNIMRVQSKLSVKPRLDFTTNQGGNDSIITFQQVVENKGLGPAIIDSISFLYNGKAYPIEIEKLLEVEAPKLLEYGYLPQHATLGRGSTLSPGEEKLIFTYQLPARNLDSVLQYLDVTLEGDSPFPIEVIYTSIYEDERWQLSSNASDPIKVD
ncbi:hypothetical protein ABV409_03035 [Flagellimonas sp. DF-77]|uniref:hypothetical protein n=1 Tax=Flagellimonas algarum TaxID=3230298 RepID=UPI0033937458